jgi:nicotinate-nucleotide adenylyltransferase
MQVGIFGGAFNPPHVAHLIVAETVRDQFGLDRVLWVPAGQPPHKQAELLAPAARRLDMVRLAIAGNPHFEVSEVELRRNGLSYTAETVAALQDKAPQTHFSLIIGGDSWRQFDRWYRPDEILSRVEVIVYERPGAPAPAHDGPVTKRVRFACAPLIDLSSRDIRSRRRSGQSIRYLVPEPVRQYILDHALYAEPVHR